MTVYNSPPFREFAQPPIRRMPHLQDPPVARDVVFDAEVRALADRIVKTDNFSRNWKQLKRHNPRGWIGHQPAWRECKPND